MLRLRPPGFVDLYSLGRLLLAGRDVARRVCPVAWCRWCVALLRLLGVGQLQVRAGGDVSGFWKLERRRREACSYCTVLQTKVCLRERQEQSVWNRKGNRSEWEADVAMRVSLGPKSRGWWWQGSARRNREPRRRPYASPGHHYAILTTTLLMKLSNPVNRELQFHIDAA